jgi:hypothetical protein
MVYPVGFFVVATDGQRGALDKVVTCRAPTVDKAAHQARSMAKNFKFKETPNLCVIKDQRAANGERLRSRVDRRGCMLRR